MHLVVIYGSCCDHEALMGIFRMSLRDYYKYLIVSYNSISKSICKYKNIMESHKLIICVDSPLLYSSFFSAFGCSNPDTPLYKWDSVSTGQSQVPNPPLRIMNLAYWSCRPLYCLGPDSTLTTINHGPAQLILELSRLGQAWTCCANKIVEGYLGMTYVGWVRKTSIYC